MKTDRYSERYLSTMSLLEILGTEGEWSARARQVGVYGKSIYELPAYDSGSKIQELQYLTLRSYWAVPKNSKQSAAGIPGVAEARNWLAKRQDWMAYLNELKADSKPSLPVPDLGSFSFCYSVQQQITGVRQIIAEDNEVNKVNLTPWSLRLRHGKGTQPTGPESPTLVALQHKQTRTRFEAGGPASRTHVATEDILDLEELRLADIDDEQSDHEPSPLASTYMPSPRTARREFPDVEDEQIVNYFLVALLGCLSFHRADTRSLWSGLRKSFKFGRGDDYLFQAQTDGHLYALKSMPSTAESFIILEVKPTYRGKTNKIIYQATAQMAAWIYCEHESGTSQTGKFRRIMILQERHDIRLIVAEYDQDYVDYIRNSPKPNTPLSLLRMNEYGPWDIDNPKEMEELGPILLALALSDGKLHL
ncbi:hypothetical protein FQN50_003092 [Emmonsiellopsis sp. PD_5]|nr:hypothetical protein FQN50_003092 [Emmonsiellopsis sp. PD_5]